MTHGQESCLVQKLSHYAEIDDVSLDILARLEEEEQEAKRDELIHKDGASNQRLYVVKQGWFYGYRDLADGRRQIVTLHHPGDIIGFSDLAFTRTTTVLRAAEPGCLCPFPKHRIDVIFERSPTLTALLFTLAARDQVILYDRMQAMGRLNARERLAHQLLDILCKLRVTNPSLGDEFRMPLNQSEIGDMLGLTNVSVSRSLASLESDGYIKRPSGRVAIRDEQALVSMSGFRDRYSRLDVTWFPGNA